MTDRTILVIGTFDTKGDELTFMADVIRGQGGRVVTMDVSVLGDPERPRITPSTMSRPPPAARSNR